MPKKILLIENDAAFAGEVSGALEAAGFGVRVTGDGKDGLDLAREWGPDGVVLCVELPGMSGYLVCQKLRKDDALKDIPLVITSAEATEATFDNHRKLKVRADEYLLKPYAPAALLDALAGLVGLPEADEQAGPAEVEIEPPAEPAFDLAPDAVGAEGDEELVTLEEEIGIEALGGEAVGDLPSLDLQGLPEEQPAGGGSSSDEDLRLLDDAFDGLSAPPAEEDPGAALDALDGERPVGAEELDAAAESLPDDGAPVGGIDRLGDDADALLGALGGPDLDPGPAFGDEPPPSRTTLRGPRAELLGAARLAAEPPARTPPPAAAATGPAISLLERELAEARDALSSARAATAAREAELGQLRQRVEALQGRAEEAEAESGRLRDRVADLSGDLETARAEAQDARGAAAEAARRATEADAALRRRNEELEAARAAASRSSALERELDEARTEILVARGEAEGARGEVEKRTGELRRRVQELEAANSKNEERVLKAYQKIKGDEKVREKIRKAIAIAGQLLDDGLPPEPTAEKSRPSPLAPRE